MIRWIAHHGVDAGLIKYREYLKAVASIKGDSVF
jgi:hypothetical protein